MENERPMIHVRLSKSLLKKVDHAAVDLELDRARTIERLLQVALDCIEEHQRTPELTVVGGVTP